MAYITKRGNSYSVRYTYEDEHGKSCDKWESFPTKEEATNRKKQIEHELAAGTFLIPSSVTVAEFLMDWLPKQCSKHKWAPKTYESNLSTIQNLIIPYIGSMEMQKLKPYHMENLYTTLSKTPCGSYIEGKKQELTEKQKQRFLSGTTIHEVHRLLGTAFQYAVEWGILVKSPVPVDSPKKSTQERTIWTVEEMRAALDSMEDPILHLAVHLTLVGALREGEIVGLTPEDLDFDAADGIGTFRINKSMQRVRKEALNQVDDGCIIKIFPDKLERSTTSLILKSTKTASSCRTIFMTSALKEELKKWLNQLAADEMKDPARYHDSGMLFRLPNGLAVEPVLIRKKFFLTNGHMAFNSIRNYRRFWAQNRTVVDDRVYKTDDTNGAGATYTDPAGGWVYYGTTNSNVNDGYAYSDTSDDVYLPDGVVIYKGGSLFESKIGVNYWNMVNADGSAVEAERGLGQAGSRAGNRVIVATGKNLDASFWGDSVAQPTARDIQFFYANDNNKNWEKSNYTLPAYYTDDMGRSICDLRATNSNKWEDRYRVTAISTSNPGINRDSSPYEGYINYDVEYPASRWASGTQGVYAGYDIATNGGYWTYYKDTSYRISDPDWTPDNSDFRPKNGEFMNSTVNFPQRSYQLTAEMKTMNKSYLQAKYIDYKVVYDTTTFGTEAAPVLRFGKTDSDTRNMYVTVNFDEANKHYYGLSNQPSFTLNDSVSTNNFTTSVNPFLNNLDQNLTNSTFTFYGANKPTGTIDIAKVVPDYSAYGKIAQLNYFLTLSNVDRLATQTSISKGSDNKELTDLYFKGWQFYTSYEYGPEVVTLDNKVARQTVSLDGSTLDYRGYFAADLSKIFNSNVNAQPCPSMTALWYSKEELAEARKKVSNVMFQTVQRKNDDGSTTNLLRFVAIAGSQYPDFDEIGFVISTTNATPTIEGGYDFVVKSRVYEKLGVNRAAGAAKTYYDVDKLLGGTYSGHQSVTVEDAKWSFTPDSEFAANVTTGATGKAGYKDAGLFYTNIVITDANKDTVYFVTPYAKMGNTYYYGESRAACYADAPTA